MKPSYRRRTLITAATLVVTLTTGITKAQDHTPTLSEATKGGIGCLVTSGAVLATGLWAGGSELVMIAAGGLLVPSGVTPLMVGLTATVVVASCGVGSAATPATLWLAEQMGIIAGTTEATIKVDANYKAAASEAAAPFPSPIPVIEESKAPDGGVEVSPTSLKSVAAIKQQALSVDSLRAVIPKQDGGHGVMSPHLQVIKQDATANTPAATPTDTPSITKPVK